jgi:hypothetical protein
MTTPTTKKLANDVARQLERRRTGRRVMLLLVLAGAIAVAILYLRCGRGFGLGTGTGPGPSTGITTIADAGPSRCAIRVTADGILVNRKPATRTAAVAICKATTGADVVVTGNARQGDWDELRAALDGAGILIFTKQR